MERQSNKRDTVNAEIVKLYQKLNDAIFFGIENEIISIKAEIEVKETLLHQKEYQPFWNEEKNKFDTYIDFVLELQNEYEQNIFDIKELTGEGNYKQVEFWTWHEVIDYSKRKSAQIQKRNAKRH